MKEDGSLSLFFSFLFAKISAKLKNESAYETYCAFANFIPHYFRLFLQQILWKVCCSFLYSGIWVWYLNLANSTKDFPCKENFTPVFPNSWAEPILFGILSQDKTLPQFWSQMWLTKPQLSDPLQYNLTYKTSKALQIVMLLLWRRFDVLFLHCSWLH